VIDFRNKKEKVLPVTINGQLIEVLQSYTFLDKKINWKENANVLMKKAQSQTVLFEKTQII